MIRSNLFWLDDEQWEKIQPLLPTEVRGKERANDRRVISGLLHVLKSGCGWCDCPRGYGPPTTICNRFTRWAERGVWEKLFRDLAARGRSTDVQMIDSTHIKAHRSASGGKGGSRRRRLDARAAGAIRNHRIENAFCRLEDFRRIAITCNPVVKSFGAEQREDGRLLGVMGEWRKRTYRTWMRHIPRRARSWRP